MPRPDFADPNNRTRVALLTRADDLNLEIVLGVQYCADSRGSHQALRLAAAHVSVAHDQRFTCQRRPNERSKRGSEILLKRP